jgi:hypothetical protein
MAVRKDSRKPNMVATLHHLRAMRRNLFLTYFLTMIVTGCGGQAVDSVTSPSTADPPAPTPSAPTSTVPAIADLSAHFSENSCTRAADGLTGRALVITFSYTDGPGDLNGGHVMLNREYNTGRSEWHSALIPSEVTLTGSQQKGSAHIVDACPLFDNSSSETETVTLFDERGNGSNSLSITVTRPPGAP